MNLKKIIEFFIFLCTFADENDEYQMFFIFVCLREIGLKTYNFWNML